MPLILNDADMIGILTPELALESLRAGLIEQANNAVQMPPRQTTDIQGSPNWLRISSAFLGESDRMGFKAMNRAAGLGMRYLVGIYQISTGELLALMDANELTTHRTAATSALGTHLLAPNAHDEVGIIGAGVQARAFVRAYAAVRELRRVNVFSPREESRQAFRDEIESKLGIDAAVCSSPEELVKSTPTVVLAMRAPKEPVLVADWLSPGYHVTGLSSVRFDAREVDDDVWRASAVVVADDRGTVFQSGDGRSAQSSGAADPDATPELFELLTGRVQRADDEQITMFKSSGNALQDIALAARVVEAAIAAGVGQQLADFPAVKDYA